MNKKILALLLVFSLLFAISPAFAIALDTSGDPLPAETQTVVEAETPETEDPAEMPPPETEDPAETEAPETEDPAESEAPETEDPVETEIPETENPAEPEIPEAEEPVEIPEEDVPGAETPEAPELYAALLAAATVDEFDALLDALTDEELESFFDSLTDEQLAAVDAHIAVLLEAEKEPIVEHVPEIINPAANVIGAAPLLPPVSAPVFERGLMGGRSAKTAAPASAEDNGLELSKVVSEPVNGEYTLTLDVYATGNKIVEETEKTLPVDIVLVLDQSGSMYNNDMPVTNYTQVTGSNRQAGNLYSNRSNLYAVLDDGSYSKVTVYRQTHYNTHTVQTSATNKNNWDDRDNNRLYHKASDGMYHLVTMARGGTTGNRTYTYSCPACGWSPETENGAGNIPSIADQLYRGTSSNGYAYIFVYTDENGNDVQQFIIGANTVVTPPTFVLSSSGTIRRLTALQNAVTKFVDSVKAKAEAEGVDHRIAIVGFSGPGYNNTELLTGVTITQGTQRSNGTNAYFPLGREYNGVQYGSITDAQYATALQDMKTTEGQNSVSAAIAALTAYGSTHTLDGLAMAEGIFSNSEIQDGERSRVVVLFTDGNTDSNRNNTVNKGYTLKDTYGATVYSVGIFSGANGTPPAQTGSGTSTQANRLMHLVSSNYPDATGDGSSAWGDLNPDLQGKSYYLSAGSADALDSVFTTIAGQIEDGGTEVTLNEQAVIKDIISEYFELATADVASNISVQAVAYTGNGTWASTGTPYDYEYVLATKTLTVTGFDFEEEYVWDGEDEDGNPLGTFGGRKILITIKIKARPEFWGGNNVPTNGPGSGVYESAGSNTPVETFDVPTANVTLKTPVLTPVNHSIYAGNPAPTPEDLVGISQIPDSDDWRTRFVTVVRAPGSISNLEDGNHTVTVTITPQTSLPGSVGPIVEAWSDSETATVTVYKPHITYQDSTVDSGTGIAGYDYNTHNRVGAVVWKNTAGTVADPVAMGTAPSLTYTYTPNTGTFTGDTPVGVKVENGSTDLTTVTTFYWIADGGGTTPTGDAKFTVHVVTPKFNLTITKNVTGGNPTQSFIFDIKQGGTTILTVAIHPEDFDGGTSASMTIHNLQNGTYTVTERGNWSWQYTLAAGQENPVTVSNTSPAASFANTRSDKNWLGDSAAAVNIGGIGRREGEDEE